MQSPDFFAAAPVIRMRDPLAEFLGAAAEGVIDYRFEDAVRLAGHSCPTVAAAFLMTRAALAALYGEELPVRGEIRVDLRDARGDGLGGDAFGPMLAGEVDDRAHGLLASLLCRMADAGLGRDGVGNKCFGHPVLTLSK